MILNPIFTARAAACRHSFVDTLEAGGEAFVPIYCCGYPKALAMGCGKACARGLVNIETGRPYECLWFSPLPDSLLKGKRAAE